MGVLPEGRLPTEKPAIASAPSVRGIRQVIDPDGGATTSDGLGVEAIPARYVLPEFEVGMLKSEFLSQYWGARWPEIERVFRGNPSIAKRLDDPNLRDYGVGRPLGDIQDYFSGLEERAIKHFRIARSPAFYSVPHIPGGDSRKPERLADLIVSSSYYNPGKKALDSNALLSLRSLVEERAFFLSAKAKLLQTRWEEMIRIDVGRIVDFGDPLYGRSFVGPLTYTGDFTQPLVPSTRGYPLFDINLPGVDWQNYPNEAGHFAGLLTIWAGSDSSLISLYDEIRTMNREFEVVMKEFLLYTL